MSKLHLLRENNFGRPALINSETSLRPRPRGFFLFKTKLKTFARVGLKAKGARRDTRSQHHFVGYRAAICGNKTQKKNSFRAARFTANCYLCKPTFSEKDHLA